MKTQIVRNNMSASLAKIQQQLDQIPEKAYDFWVRATPKKSGNARRRTSFKTGDTIHANYDYAQALDQGASRQAPDGMVRPTTRYITRLVRNIRK
jgi:hypothetical protein